MKKTLFLLAVITAFIVVGCGNEKKPEYDKNGNKIEYNEKGERVYKMGNKSTFGDYIGKKSSEPLHQFKTDHK